MNSTPPKIHPANTRFAAILVAVTVAGIAATVFFFNPSSHRFYPVCQFHRLTGLNCPGCGATRALSALLHGDFLTALRDNVLLVGALAAAALRGGWLGLKKLRGQSGGEFFPVKFLIPLFVVALVFTVLRNLPAFAFLSPSPL
jgi:hypothetical protein